MCGCALNNEVNNNSVLFLIQWDANIKWPGILEFNRNWIAYPNKTIIVNKDSPIDSLTLINQKTITSTTCKCRPPLQCHTRALGPVYRLTGIFHLGEEDWWSVLVNRAKSRDWKPSRRLTTWLRLFESWITLSSGSSRSNPEDRGSSPRSNFSLTRGDWTKFPLPRINYPGDLVHRQYCLATSGTQNIF